MAHMPFDAHWRRRRTRRCRPFGCLTTTTLTDGATFLLGSYSRFQHQADGAAPAVGIGAGTSPPAQGGDLLETSATHRAMPAFEVRIQWAFPASLADAALQKWQRRTPAIRRPA